SGSASAAPTTSPSFSAISAKRSSRTGLSSLAYAQLAVGERHEAPVVLPCRVVHVRPREVADAGQRAVGGHAGLRRPGRPRAVQRTRGPFPAGGRAPGPARRRRGRLSTRAGMARAEAIILWHITVSHFSEKARWALEYKSVAHQRRTPLP